MNALILAAGLGTRLRPLTDTMPKAMVPVAGKPLLQHLIENLKSAGFQNIVVNVHHFPDQIIDFLRANQNFGLHIDVSDEREKLLNTGGAIKKALPLFPNQQPVLIHNVDILHNIDLRSFYLENASESASTLLVSDRNSSRKLIFDTHGQLVGWTNLQSGELRAPQPLPAETHQRAFSGIHIVSPSILPLMESWPDAFSIIDFYLDNCHRTSIKAVEIENAQIVDVGKFQTLAKAEEFLQNRL